MKRKHAKEEWDESYSLAYNSLFDEAYNMACTLKRIDDELREAARCEGDYPGGYPPSDLLPNLCKIMYADHEYWKNEKYWNLGLKPKPKGDTEHEDKA